LREALMQHDYPLTLTRVGQLAEDRLPGRRPIDG